jgi:putative transposase
MDLQGAGSSARYLIRDRDGKYPALFDAILADSGTTVVHSGVQLPRMTATMERWVRTCRSDCSTEPWPGTSGTSWTPCADTRRSTTPTGLLQGIANARPLQPLPEPITDLSQLTQLRIHRRNRFGGILHEYEHAA